MRVPAALALRAGIDVDLMGGAYGRGLPTALERGLVTIEQVDAAVRRVLGLKARLGLFDDAYRRSDNMRHGHKRLFGSSDPRDAR